MKSKYIWWIAGALFIGLLFGFFISPRFIPYAASPIPPGITGTPNSNFPGMWTGFNGNMMSPSGIMGPGMMGGGFALDRWNRQYRSNGERIYFTSTDAKGQRISANMMGMEIEGMNMSCVDCHGEDGAGRTVQMMMGSFSAPDIRFGNTDRDRRVAAKDNKPEYTDSTLRRAIVEGIDPGRKQLAYPMPRWHINDRDVKDIINYLQTL
ncbi:MAG: c-type cytochrome [Bacillota bacterium]